MRSTQDPFSHRLLVLWPTIMLCAVAGRQMYAAGFGLLSPWKGGGFGMFAAMDDPGNRALECRGRTASGEAVVLQLGNGWSDGRGVRSYILRRLRTYPRLDDLRLLVRGLLDGDYVEADGASLAVRAEFLRSNPRLSAKFPSPRQWPTKVLVPRDRRRVADGQATVYKLTWAEAAVSRLHFDPSDCSLRPAVVLGPETAQTTPE